MYVRDIVPRAHVLGHHHVPPNFLIIGHQSLILVIPYSNDPIEFMLPYPSIYGNIGMHTTPLVA